MRSLIEIYQDKIDPLLLMPEPLITKEESLDFLEQAGQKVLNFCRRGDIPPSLRHTVASIARDLLIAELSWRGELNPEEEAILDKIDINHVKKIAIGDTEVQLSTPNERKHAQSSSSGIGNNKDALWNAIVHTHYYDLIHHRRTVFTGHHEVNIYG